MKLAIASTTLLFAMMAAQAAVLSATSSTDVNLVKRAPNGDGETNKALWPMSKLAELIQSQRGEISALKFLVKQLKRTCEGEASSECSNINAEISEFKKEIDGLKKQLEKTTEEYGTGLDGYSRVVNAIHGENFSYLRQYLWDHQDQ
ncbi:hypothetical protein BASA50_008608 [Batrachochytrium salamandrivorans]|uniref:Uncharacterized protein n=1 Tax=Batrachochytrium salamandrivorans TaxID=1357716 RepID=A0ABQ8F4V6_9FUNG|nr:hypothetical protein BASA50_008608 [Batrachochytrium salamandrivorans]